jgi:regulatory protein
VDLGEASDPEVARVADLGVLPVPIGEHGGTAPGAGVADRRAAGRRAVARRRASASSGGVGADGAGVGATRAAGARTADGTSTGRHEQDADADPETVARAICLRLLTDRARTRQELGQALRRKGVPDDAANTVLERFDDVGLIDDHAFAEQWVRSRHTFRGLGRRALAVELRRRGVADEVAGEALAAVDDESEEQRARELVERKLRTLRADTDEKRAAAARRLVGMLARKGYGGGVSYRVVREALAAHGAELAELDSEPPADA